MFDILILAKKEDFNKIKFLLDSVKNNITGYDGIYVISNEPFIMDGVINYTDEMVLDISYKDKIRYRPNWIFQQFLKLFQNITKNDVLMYSDLLDVHNKLTNIDKEIHLVVNSETRCIPSIIFFKSPSIANKLCNYIITNNTRNDMVNLYCFFNENKEIVGNLPIIPNNVDVNLVNMGGTIASGLINYSNLFTELESVFDGACIGQYLGGVDPRNNPSDTIGFINETTIFDVSIFKYEFINGEPFMILSNDTKVKINNLHIHSKKLQKFINI